MAKERVALWDNVKFFLMITVVVCHLVALDTEGSHLFRCVFMFITAFHMPLFIFISGLFHKNKNIKEKVISYFAVYMAVKIGYLLVRMATHKKIVFELFTEDALPWFMFATAVFILITYLLRDIDKKYILMIALMLGLFSGYDKNTGDFLVMSRIIVYYPFYLLGTMVNKERIEALAQKRYIKAASGAVLLAWGAICFFLTDKIYILRPLLTGRNSFGKDIVDYGLFYRAGVYVLAAVIGLCFILVTPSFKLGKITDFGQRTLQVYFWHNLIIKFIFYSGGYEFFEKTGYLKLAWALLGIPLTFILSLSIFKFPLNYLMYNPKKKTKSE